jgi:hypothetical protein
MLRVKSVNLKTTHLIILILALVAGMSTGCKKKDVEAQQLSFEVSRLVRLVWRERGKEEEEGLVLILFIDQPDRLVADQRRVVALLGEELAVALPVDQTSAHFAEVVHFADKVAVKGIESSVLGPEFLVGMTQMPLAYHHGPVIKAAREGVQTGMP